MRAAWGDTSLIATSLRDSLLHLKSGPKKYFPLIHVWRISNVHSSDHHDLTFSRCFILRSVLLRMAGPQLKAILGPKRYRTISILS